MRRWPDELPQQGEYVSKWATWSVSELVVRARLSVSRMNPTPHHNPNPNPNLNRAHLLLTYSLTTNLLQALDTFNTAMVSSVYYIFF